MKSNSLIISCAVLALIFLISPFNYLHAENKGIHAQIDELVLQSEFEKAEKKAQDFLSDHPEDTEATCALACVYRNKALKSAVNVNTDAMGIKEGESGTYEIKDSSNIKELFSEQQYYDKDEYKKAEELYLKIIKMDPGYKNAYFNLLNDYADMAEYEKYFGIIDLFIKNLKHDKDTPYQLNDLASKLYKKEINDQASKLYTVIIDNFPDFHEARSDMGALYAQQGQYIQAKKIFSEVYEKSPDDLINLRNYYLSCVFTEDFETSYSLVKKILEHENNADNRAFDFVLLSVLLNKNHTSAINEYLKTKASEIKDTSKDFWYQSTLELSKLDTYEKEEKISFLEYLLDQVSKANYSDLAIIVANIIEQIEPTNYALLVHASIYDRHMFFEKTIEYLDKIKKRRELVPEIMTEYDLNWNYGRNYYAAKKYEIAKNYLIKNYKINNSDAKINYYLGKCYLFLGQKNEAVKLFTINKKMDDKSQMTFINYSIRELNNL